MNKASKTHAGAGKQVLRYLARIIDYRLWYAYSNGCKVVGFSDSDWAESLEDRKSTSWVVFKLGSTIVLWISKKQEVIALSTIEDEYIAISSVACQCLWLRKLLGDCGIEGKDATEIWCDNKSAIAIARNLMHHRRTKHIDIKFHHFRNLICNGIVMILKHCSTTEQITDLLTKPLLSRSITCWEFRWVRATFNHGENMLVC